MNIREQLGYFSADRVFDDIYSALENLPSDINAVLLDLDGVLLEVKAGHPEPEEGFNIESELLNLVKDIESDYEACIATNRVRYDDFRPESIENFFGLEVVDCGYTKPSPKFFDSALTIMEASPEKTVFIGDSPFADIYGGNRAGLRTYQVDHDRSDYEFPLNITKRGEDLFQRFASYLER